MKKLSIIVLSLFLITLTSCSSGFDKDKALKESESELNKFFQAYEQDKEVFSFTEDNLNEKTAEFIKGKPSGFFTKAFLNETKNAAENSTFGNPFKDKHLFFLVQKTSGSIRDSKYSAIFNQYEIKDRSNAEVDEGKETVTFPCQSKDKMHLLAIEMKKENGTWKINNVNKP